MISTDDLKLDQEVIIMIMGEENRATIKDISKDTGWFEVQFNGGEKDGETAKYNATNFKWGDGDDKKLIFESNYLKEASGHNYEQALEKQRKWAEELKADIKEYEDWINDPTVSQTLKDFAKRSIERAKKLLKEYSPDALKERTNYIATTTSKIVKDKGLIKKHFKSPESLNAFLASPEGATWEKWGSKMMEAHYADPRTKEDIVEVIEDFILDNDIGTKTVQIDTVKASKDIYDFLVNSNLLNINNIKDVDNKISENLATEITEENTFKQNLMIAIQSESDAINIYDKLINQAESEQSRKVIADIRDEEQVHMGQLNKLVEILDPNYEDNEKKGEQETQEQVSEEIEVNEGAEVNGLGIIPKTITKKTILGPLDGNSAEKIEEDKSLDALIKKLDNYKPEEKSPEIKNLWDIFLQKNKTSSPDDRQSAIDNLLRLGEIDDVSYERLKRNVELQREKEIQKEQDRLKQDELELDIKNNPEKYKNLKKENLIARRDNLIKSIKNGESKDGDLEAELNYINSELKSEHNVSPVWESIKDEKLNVITRFLQRLLPKSESDIWGGMATFDLGGRGDAKIAWLPTNPNDHKSVHGVLVYTKFGKEMGKLKFYGPRREDKVIEEEILNFLADNKLIKTT